MPSKCLMFTPAVLVDAMFKSLSLLPLDLDAVGLEVIAEDEQIVEVLEGYGRTVNDFTDWRAIWAWKDYDDVDPEDDAYGALNDEEASIPALTL